MTSEPTIVGIDLGKNWFHLIGLDVRGATVLRRKMNRLQLAEYAAAAPQCVVAMESCPGSQYWGRAFTKAGHEVRLLPAQFVKPFLKANKNDFNDAEAIAEAGGRASMRCVPLKTNEQLELQAAEPDITAPIDSVVGHDADPSTPWMPEFDDDDDLDGLLDVESPLLARAFRGTDRAR